MDRVDSLRSRIESYTAYGYSASGTLNSVLGFNGEHRSDFSGLYMLGRGARSFSPVLMRFMSADPYSPFSLGGLNAYAYCAGDPINRVDRSGYMFSPIMTQKLHRWRISAQLSVAYRDAPAAKQIVDAQAATVANNHNGFLITAPIKQDRLRIIDNVQRLDIKHPRKLGDLVRNTVVLPQEHMLAAAKELAKISKSKPQVFKGSGAGYQGIHVRSKPTGGNGIYGETQFHTRQQAFAIFPENVARPAIGTGLYDAWSASANAQGYTPGQAHSLYEVFRMSGAAQNVRDAALSKSRSYWSFISSLE